VNRIAVLYADGPGNAFKKVAVVIAVFGERIGAIADAGAVGLRVEERRDVAILAAYIHEDAPVGVVEGSGAIILDGELVQFDLKSAHWRGSGAVGFVGNVVPADENALGKEVSLRPGKRENDA